MKIDTRKSDFFIGAKSSKMTLNKDGTVTITKTLNQEDEPCGEDTAYVFPTNATITTGTLNASEIDSAE